MKKFLPGLVVSFTILSSTVVQAGSIYSNPWKLLSEIVITPASHAIYYKHVIFQGSILDLEEYVKYWKIKTKVYYDFTVPGGQQIRGVNYLGAGKLWAICHEIKSGPYHPVACVAVDSRGRALDPNIYRAEYRWSVYNNS